MSKYTITVDVDKWLTPNRRKYVYGYHPSGLLNEDGLMCCLGFACKAEGVPDDKLLNKAMPGCGDVPDALGAEAKALFVTEIGHGDTPLATVAANINDCAAISNGTRMTLLYQLFSANGVHLRFTRGGFPCPFGIYPENTDKLTAWVDGVDYHKREAKRARDRAYRARKRAAKEAAKAQQGQVL